VDTFVAKVRQAVNLAAPNEFTVVYCHTPLKLYKPENEWLFEKLFNDLAGLVDSGLVKYATQGEIYDYFLEWEQTTSILENQNNSPETFCLFQNYPNPFNSSTTISYQIAAPAKVNLEIYNLSGQRMRSIENTKQQAGFHSIVWNGRDDSGNLVCTGIYFYQLKINQNICCSKKLLFLK
jgi:hypothetical protein